MHVCVCSVAQSCPALFHPCLREAKPESHFSVATTGMRKPEERGRNDVLSPRFLIHLLQPSDIYAKFRPSRISGLWTSLSYAANGKMAKQPAVEEVLIQGKKHTNNCWAFSLANISILSPCVSKLQLPKWELQKQIQDGCYCRQNIAIPNLGGSPGGVPNKGALLFSSLFPWFPIKKPRNHHLNLRIV